MKKGGRLKIVISPGKLSVSAGQTDHVTDIARVHRVFWLERIERVWRDLVDFEGLTWGGPLPTGRF